MSLSELGKGKVSASAILHAHSCKSSLHRSGTPKFGNTIAPTHGETPATKQSTMSRAAASTTNCRVRSFRPVCKNPKTSRCVLKRLIPIVDIKQTRAVTHFQANIRQAQEKEQQCKALFSLTLVHKTPKNKYANTYHSCRRIRPPSSPSVPALFSINIIFIYHAIPSTNASIIDKDD